MKIVSLPAGVLALTLTLAAQNQPPASTSLRGPVLGFVFDPAVQGLRPIQGIPGAGTLGPVLDLGGVRIAQAAVPAGRNFALALDADSRRPLLCVDLTAPVCGPVPGDAPAGADRIVLSPAGRAAAIVYDASSQALILSGLPANPSVAPVDISAAGGPVSALAINDDGGVVLFAVAEDGGAALYLARPEAAPRAIARAAAISAIAFLGSGTDAVFADSAGDRVFLLRDVLGGGVPVPLAGDAGGIHQPFAIAAADDSQILVAGADGSLAAVTLADSSVQPILCDCKATQLGRLNDGGVFLLTEDVRQPMWLLQAAASDKRTTFVPALPPTP
jgi:hypothetical protein